MATDSANHEQGDPPGGQGGDRHDHNPGGSHGHDRHGSPGHDQAEGHLQEGHEESKKRKRVDDHVETGSTSASRVGRKLPAGKVGVAPWTPLQVWYKGKSRRVHWVSAHLGFGRPVTEEPLSQIEEKG